LPTHFPEQFQGPHDLPDGTSILVTVRQAGMHGTRGSQSQEIVILREDDPALSEPVGDLCGIVGPEKIRVGRAGNVDAPLP
jgi:hypothetical protein